MTFPSQSPPDETEAMNQFPFAVAPLEAIRFAHDEALCITDLQHDVHALNRAYEAPVAVHDDVRFEDVHLARGIAQLLRMRWFRPVHAKSAGSQEARALYLKAASIPPRRHGSR